MHPDCGMFNVANRATLVSFVGVNKTVIKEKTVVHLHKTSRGQGQPQYEQGNNRGPPPRGQGGQNLEKNEFHPFYGRWHAQGQYWSEGQGYGCSN